jgi:hypothetical protein
MAPEQEVRHSPVAALLYGAPIGLLGGLIGLGGAEFRLPVLAGVFSYTARRAVALNLAISLVTVVSALLIRGGTLSLEPLIALLPVVLARIVGAVSAAFFGVAFVHRISEVLLERLILVLLVGIGTALVVEAFLPREASAYRKAQWKGYASPSLLCWECSSAWSAVYSGLLAANLSYLRWCSCSEPGSSVLAQRAS